MTGDRLARVLGTGRVEAAPREPARGQTLVEADDGIEHPGR
ncbi:MAG: hypothetical protein QOH10_114 [Actinomycetota bacterium]|nr:hypothetical protein [Actinomycetota bacterium]